MNAAYVFLITFMYLAAIIFGAFLLPLFCTKETFFRLMRRINHLETNHRDGLLLFLVSPLARLGIHPNALTLAGFFLTFVLAAAFWYETYPVVIFSIALFSGLSDMFDGILARASQKAMEMAAEEGLAVGLLRPLTLWPFPYGALRQNLRDGVQSQGWTTVRGTATRLILISVCVA